MTLAQIQLSIADMKMAIMHAFSEHTLAMDRDVRNAIEKFCSQENIAEVIEREVNNALGEIIADATRKFFQSVEIRKTISDAFIQHLKEGKK